MFNPAEASEHIKQEFIDYILTRNALPDKDMRALLRQRLESTIANGPIVDIKDVFLSIETIEDLVCEDRLSKLFLDLEKKKPTDYKRWLPTNRRLYVHQIRAIEKLLAGRNAVITTGTGSGKTECFLIPLLDALLREKELGTLGPGVRVILIYPMNALANDQMKRLRNLLMYYPDITFGVYSGDTDHHIGNAEATYAQLHQADECSELREPLRNERISRDQMQKSPPHILCTNYAMLEYMMLRPNDGKVFEGAKIRYVVLDEAHIYRGATGMETAMLLRRLKSRLSGVSNVQFVLTSATLGRQGKSEPDIIQFAENLTGGHFAPDDVIFGEREPQLLQGVGIQVDVNLFSRIAEASTAIQGEDWKVRISSIFEQHGMPYRKDLQPSENIYILCIESSLYHVMREKVRGPVDMEEFARCLNVSKQQAIEFIHVCTLAEKDKKALIDARYHFLLRALEGLYAPLNGEKELFLERRTQMPNGDTVFEIAICNTCDSMAVVGEVTRNSQNGIEYLVQTNRYESKKRHFHICKQNVNDQEIAPEDLQSIGEEQEEDSENTRKNPKIIDWWLCTHCGAVSKKMEGRPHCSCGSSSLLPVCEFEGAETRCPNCLQGAYYRFYLGQEAATAVLATSLYECLPTQKVTCKRNGQIWEWNGGKQFLSFSDSRPEAAYFAPYLKKSYEEFLRRRAIVHIIQGKRCESERDGYDYTIQDLIDDLIVLFKKRKAFVEPLDQEPRNRELEKICRQQAWMAALNELIYFNRKDSLVSLGCMQFHYAGNTPEIVDRFSRLYCLPHETCYALLDALAMTIAQAGAVCTERDDDLDADQHKYIFYTELELYMIRQCVDRTPTTHTGWLPRTYRGQNEKWYWSNRLSMVRVYIFPCKWEQ